MFGPIDPVQQYQEVESYQDNLEKALVDAAGDGRLDLVQYLISRMRSVSYTPLVFRVAGHERAMRHLIREATGSAIGGGHLPVVKYLLTQDVDDLIPFLHYARNIGQYEIVEYLESL